MQSIRQVVNAFMIAVTSLLLVVGGISLSMAEGGFLAMVEEASKTTQTPLASPTPTQALAFTQEFVATVTPTLTPTLAPTECIKPQGWVAIIVQQGQTLESIAQDYSLSSNSILQANCLQNPEIPVGTMIYVLPKPSQPVPTQPKCGAPAGWTIYVVKPGDTLYSIATRYRITVAQLQFANCLTSTLIISGTRLNVPNVATSTPIATLPGILTMTPTATETSTLAPTDTPTDTPIPDTDTPVPPTPTETVTPTP